MQLHAMGWHQMLHNPECQNEGWKGPGLPNELQGYEVPKHPHKGKVGKSKVCEVEQPMWLLLAVKGQAQHTGDEKDVVVGGVLHMEGVHHHTEE